MRLKYDEAETPHQLKDEDRWFKFFSKKQLIVVIPVAIVILIIMYLAIKNNHLVGGIIISAIVAILVIGPIKFPMPQDMYLFGGGEPIYRFILCKILYYINRSKRIYIRCARGKNER